MKAICLLTLLNVISAFAIQDTDRMDEFLQKLDKFYESVRRNSRDWSMPNFKTVDTTANMPMPAIRFVDEETGLEYSPHTRKIYSPDLDIGLDATTDTIYDFKTGKKYNIHQLERQREQ